MKEILLLVGFFALAFFLTRLVQKVGGVGGGC